jgi:transposase InsO family protein
MDNGTQFTGRKFLRFCDDNHIRVDWAAVAHPRTNGHVERANGMVLQGLKPRIFNRLNKFGGWWVAELPAVLWSLRTTRSRAKRATKDRHKLSSPWEGPYIVAEVLRPGTYKLATADGEVFTNASNIEQLCRFYP